MTVDDPIPSADDADVVEQSLDVDSDDTDEYPATSRDVVEDEDDAISPVSRDQRH